MLLEIAGNAYVLRVISESESPLRRNTESYAMKDAAAEGQAKVALESAKAIDVNDVD